MGTWGSDNFDDDTALEWLHGFMRSIIDEIERAMKDPSSLEPLEYHGVIVPCQIEVLCCISEKIGGGGLPSKNVVEGWKERYLSVWDAVWDGYIDQLRPNESHRQARRAVLVSTFDRLKSLAPDE